VCLYRRPRRCNAFTDLNPRMADVVLTTPRPEAHMWAKQRRSPLHDPATRACLFASLRPMPITTTTHWAST
jgi:hypothetical protein